MMSAPGPWPARTSPRLSESSTLADGTALTLRSIRPDDAEPLRAMFHRLSAESRYHRFFGMLGDLSPDMLRYLTQVDGVDHVAIVAIMPDDAGAGERIVGVARFIRTESRDVAEAAFTVVDDMQRKGLGTRLLAALTSAARADGVRSFRLEVKRSNVAMRRLLDEAGATLVCESLGDMTYDVALRHSPLGLLLEVLTVQTSLFFALLRGPLRARDRRDGAPPVG